MRKMKKTAYWLGVCLLMAGGAQAGTILWDAGSGVDTEWNNPLNWVGDGVPGNGVTNDVALLGSSLDTTVTSAVTSHVQSVTLVMRNGANLAIADDMAFLGMRIGDNGGSGGNVSHTAGMVTSEVCTVGILTGSSYALSGSAGLALGTDLSCGTNGLISLSGSSASVMVGGSMSVEGSLAFTLDDTGVNSIHVTSNLLVDANARLTVNASGYTGGAATFDLVTFATDSGSFASNNISVLGAKSWSVGTDADSLFVTLVPYSEGDTLIIGQDDFDGAEIYASRVVANELDNGNVLFKIVNRDIIKTDEVIDTSVAAGGLVPLNTGDTFGFLGINKTDNIFGMYRAGATRSLTYTFNITGYTNLNLSMDWAASGSLTDKGVSMTYSIDGAAATTIFVVVPALGAGWSETMDNGTVYERARSGSVLVNGVATNSLTDVFQTYAPTIAGTGTNLTVTIVQTSTAGAYGGFGMDNLKLNGTIAGTPRPPPEIGDMTIEVVSGGTEVALSWSTEFGYTYGVQAKDNLVIDSWDNIITNIPGTGFEVTVTNAIAPDAEFYQAYLEK